MSDKIISLCYVSKRNDKTTELCRIADWIDGDFVPYVYNTGKDFYDTERDLIYGSTALLQAELDSIGVFEWSTYLSTSNVWRTETQKTTDISWSEVVYTKQDTIDELLQVLKRGYPISQYDRLHDIILCCRPNKNICEALYISKADAVFRDGKLCLLDSVVTLPRDTLDTRYATGDCKCRYSPYDMRKYLARKDACHVMGTVEVKTTEEVVGEVIKQFIGKDVVGRKERQNVRLALEKLMVPSVVEIIATRFHWTSKHAEKYVKDYILYMQKKLDSTVSLQLIDLMIENDSDSVQRMRVAVREQWEETQHKQIETEQQRQAAALATLEEIQSKIVKETEQLQKLQEQQLEAETKTKEASMLQEQIEREIQKRLEEFKKDYASVLVQNAVITASSIPFSRSIENVTDSQKWSAILPEGDVMDGSLDENYAEAVECWADICASREMAQGLAAMTYAAYVNRHPLLIIGEGAVEIADLVSSTVCGQSSIKLFIGDDTENFDSILKAISKAPDAAICAVNGLKTGYDKLRTFMQLCPQRMFIITELHAESLLMEPASLFSSFIPVFCDYFYTGGRIEDLPGYNCANELQKKADTITARELKEARVTVLKWFSEGFYPPIVRERCAKLLATINKLAQTMNVNANGALAAAVEFVFVPVMKCMRRENSLKDHLDACTVIDSERKANLISFIDMED